MRLLSESSMRKRMGNLLFSSFFLTGWDQMRDHPYMMRYWFGGFLMWIFILILIGAIVYFIVSSQKGQRPPVERKESPMEILRIRYARGEITKEQFEQMKRDLQE
jgi:putative membrane protein